MQASFVSAAQPARVRVSSCHQRQRITRLYSPGSSGRLHHGQPRATADVHADPQPAPSTSGPADTPTSSSSQISNGSIQPVTGVSSEAAEAGQARSASPSWEGTTTGEETDWVGEKPFTWKDIDWGESMSLGKLGMYMTQPKILWLQQQHQRVLFVVQPWVINGGRLPGPNSTSRLSLQALPA